MIQIEDDVYNQLQKDADDNKQIVHMIRMIIIAICITIIFCIMFFTWGVKLIDLDIQKRSAELKNEIALEVADTNYKIMTIESKDMNMDDYLRWLEVRNDYGK